MNYLFYLFTAIVIFKFINNSNNYFQCKRLLRKYDEYLKVKNNWSFLGYQKKIIQLFKNAGVEDSVVPLVQQLDFNNVMTAKASFFDNLNIESEDITSLTLKAFYQSIGVYRQRIIDSINPLFWINLLIYLPKKVFQFLGFNNNIVSNLVQFFYWLTYIIVALLSIDDIEFLKGIKDWINTIL